MASPFNRYNLGLFNSGNYFPFICDISAVTLGETTVVTTSENHGFVVGNQVQFFIPRQWGISQLNILKGNVISIPQPDQITVNINSLRFDAFITPSSLPYVVIDVPQVAGIGDNNFGNFAPGGVVAIPNTIPGAFKNEPPN